MRVFGRVVRSVAVTATPASVRAKRTTVPPSARAAVHAGVLAQPAQALLRVVAPQVFLGWLLRCR